MSRQRLDPYTALTAQAATGASPAFFSGDHRHQTFQVTAPVNTSLTFKFVASNSKEAPDFSAAQSETNVYDFVEVIDLQDHSAIDGDTGVALDNTTAAVNVRRYEVNDNNPRWVGIVVSAYTDGSLSATLDLVND